MVFHKIPYFLQFFPENFIQTLKHGSLLKKLLVFAKSKSFDSFSQDAKFFATLC